MYNGVTLKDEYMTPSRTKEMIRIKCLSIPYVHVSLFHFYFHLKHVSIPCL